MARKQAGRVRFDEFVGAVRPDPGRPDPLIMLAGYVGRGGEAGQLRIHPDASLNHWYEVADEDVVHSAPIENSPLGGSNVWLKASSPIGYGIAAPAPTEPPQSEAAAPDTTAPVAATPHPLGAPPPAFTQQLCPTTMPPGCALPGPAVMPTQSLIACMPMQPQGPPTQSLMACMPMQPPGGPPTQSLMACMPMQPQGTLPTAPTMFCQPATGLTFAGCRPPPPAPPIWSLGCPPPTPAGPAWTAGCPAVAPTQGCPQTILAQCLNPFQPGGPTLAGCPGVSLVFMCPPR